MRDPPASAEPHQRRALLALGSSGKQLLVKSKEFAAAGIGVDCVVKVGDEVEQSRLQPTGLLAALVRAFNDGSQSVLLGFGRNMRRLLTIIICSRLSLVYVVGEQ